MHTSNSTQRQKEKEEEEKKDTALRPTGTMLFNFNTAWKKKKTAKL